ncbi:phosphopentomutase [Legionella quinlivanii]|uniref:Phosphopentomutase n=1 Tax=Legionella quinlivanii TaxID=45073 RepID=A0A0W0Y1C9_9GAMM|nr:phosphopentomutase [Legionella quinlivanii]KTD50438.1 phosphopentomutase [Legionella quinlivanii]MCW8449809.1 phosphopentomutase [Legionella quinlivanii]SEF40225.1 phosphopentomutase [Legionella quinlivanii DSM 21216]STY12038.1 phosphopentomutase [Legionella quinlivanii]
MLGRVCILLMDSFGLGASQDAIRYGDQGADTFGHIHAACAEGQADRENVRQGPLMLPNLARLGLYHAALASTGIPRIDLSTLDEPQGYYGYAVEQSLGKDTPSGHWELAGVPVLFEWGYFPDTPNCFPEKLIADFIRETKIAGVLGLKHASGTHIIDELGEAHILSNQPIVYTSADSVFQIAAHEDYFGLDRLYEICEVARRLVDEYQIGRVIARPFIGKPGAFTRTGNRKDYATLPPAPTLLDKLKANNREVIAIGKVADIYAHQGLTQTIKADGNMALFDATLKAMNTAPSGSLVFTNFVDFDSSFGHRRDVIGYARALEAFDARLPELLAILQPDDLIVIAADHGCDPTQPGSDHTREHIPVLAFGKNTPSCFIGRRDSFADIGQSIAEYLAIEPLENGISFLKTAAPDDVS